MQDESTISRSRVEGLWQVSTADVRDWATIVLFHGHGSRKDSDRAESCVTIMNEPPHRQPGLSRGSVSKALKAEGLQPGDEEWISRVRQLVPEQGTITSDCAIMLMLGAGLLSAESLEQRFGVPTTSPSGLDLVYSLTSRENRLNVRPFVACYASVPSCSLRKLPVL